MLLTRYSSAMNVGENNTGHTQLSMVASKIMHSVSASESKTVEVGVLLDRGLLDNKDLATLVEAGIEISEIELRNGVSRSVVFKTKHGGPIIITDLLGAVSRTVQVREVVPFVSESIQRSLCEDHWIIQIETDGPVNLTVTEQAVAFAFTASLIKEKLFEINGIFHQFGFGCFKEDSVNDCVRVHIYEFQTAEPKLIASLFESVLFSLGLNGDEVVRISVG